MTKFVVVLFGALTLGAAYMTFYDVGVMEPTVKKASAREGSVHGGFRSSGRIRGK